eukprot:10062-Heterococcus_DN1.PRE.1
MTALGVDKIISGTDLKTLGFTNSSPAIDTRVPDIILVTTPGVIYTTKNKLSEHGGFSKDDTNVALMLMGASLKPTVSQAPVETTQHVYTHVKQHRNTHTLLLVLVLLLDVNTVSIH